MKNVTEILQCHLKSPRVSAPVKESINNYNRHQKSSETPRSLAHLILVERSLSQSIIKRNLIALSRVRCPDISSPQLILVKFILDLIRRHLILKVPQRAFYSFDKLFEGEVAFSMSFGDEDCHLYDVNLQS